MKKLTFGSVLVLIVCLLFSFTSVNQIRNTYAEGIYLPANCKSPVLFEIESQEPCNIFEVNPNTGRLSLLSPDMVDFCLSYESFSENGSSIKIRYNVTNADGVRKGHFIILDLEGEE